MISGAAQQFDPSIETSHDTSGRSTRGASADPPWNAHSAVSGENEPHAVPLHLGTARIEPFRQMGCADLSTEKSWIFVWLVAAKESRAAATNTTATSLRMAQTQ